MLELLLAAEGSVVTRILNRFAENMGFLQLMLIVGVLAVVLYIILARRTMAALLFVVALSLLTSTRSDEISSIAQLGRWGFVAMAAACALMMRGATHDGLVGVTAIWATLNVVGCAYSPNLEVAAFRTLYFLLAIPAFMISMGSPAQNMTAILKLVKHTGMVGLLLAVAHVFFIAVAPAGGGISRFGSFYSSPQPMSLATCAVTLPMVWLVLSGRAGKLLTPLVIGILINLTVIVASTQRTALFSLGGAIVVMLYYYRSRGAMLALVGGVGLAVVAWPIITFLVSKDFLAQRLGNLESEGRMRVWSYAFQEAMKSPIIGRGNGAATDFGQDVFNKKFHNAYLAVFFDLGIVGLSVFVLMIVMGVYLAWRLTQSRDPDRKALGVFLLAALLQVAAQGVVETGLADTANQTATQFYLSLGMVAALIKMPDAQPRLLIPLAPAMVPRPTRPGPRPPRQSPPMPAPARVAPPGVSGPGS